MHFADTLQVAVALFLSACSVQAQAIIPYKDGQCTQPVTDYKLDGNSEPVSIWDNAAGWPSVSRYSAPTFPGAESKTGGGYTVYWKIAQPGPGCRVAIMQPYGQTMYGSMSFPAPPGNVVLVAAKAGCYYSSVPQGVDLISTFCCGTGDCAPLSVGNAALLKREDTSLSLFSKASAAISDSIVSIFLPTQPSHPPNNSPDPPTIQHLPNRQSRHLQSPKSTRRLRHEQLQSHRRRHLLPPSRSANHGRRPAALRHGPLLLLHHPRPYRVHLLQHLAGPNHHQHRRRQHRHQNRRRLHRRSRRHRHGRVLVGAVDFQEHEHEHHECHDHHRDEYAGPAAGHVCVCDVYADVPVLDGEGGLRWGVVVDDEFLPAADGE